MPKCLLLLCCAGWLALAFAPTPPDAAVSIRIHSVKNSLGLVRVAVYKRAENFNETPDFAFAFVKTGLQNGVLDCRFALPPGQYAFSVMDDSDGNNAMKYNWLGLPVEGFGFSNDASLRAPFGPSFEDCKIQIGTTGNFFQIKMRYL